VEPKSPSESSIITYQLAMPAYSNPSWKDNSLDIGAINGGAILNLVDNVAGWVALRHCRSRAVTASIDKMDFLNPVHVGELIRLKASVNYTGRTSLEVGVSIEVENVYTGTITKTGKAYLTMVAVDDDNKPIPVPPLKLTNKIEERRYNDAEKRRQKRLSNKS